MAFTSRIERLGDTVVGLQSFAGSEKEKNPVYKEYHGMSIDSLNTINAAIV